jgi:hypothetical protein
MSNMLTSKFNFYTINSPIQRVASNSDIKLMKVSLSFVLIIKLNKSGLVTAQFNFILILY